MGIKGIEHTINDEGFVDLRNKAFRFDVDNFERIPSEPNETCSRTAADTLSPEVELIRRFWGTEPTVSSLAQKIERHLASQLIALAKGIPSLAPRNNVENGVFTQWVANIYPQLLISPSAELNFAAPAYSRENTETSDFSSTSISRQENFPTHLDEQANPVSSGDLHPFFAEVRTQLLARDVAISALHLFAGKYLSNTSSEELGDFQAAEASNSRDFAYEALRDVTIEFAPQLQRFHELLAQIQDDFLQMNQEKIRKVSSARIALQGRSTQTDTVFLTQARLLSFLEECALITKATLRFPSSSRKQICELPMLARSLASTAPYSDSPSLSLLSQTEMHAGELRSILRELSAAVTRTYVRVKTRSSL